MQQQFQAFRDKFGRDPGPHDPVFFDPDSHAPTLLPLERLQREVVGGMMRAGLSPALIYAYCRTGLVATEENYSLLSPRDRVAWECAIEEYFQKGVR
jgi:hypothetical protein